jgi:hypothetical protein
VHAVETLGICGTISNRTGEDIAAIEVGILKDELDLIQTRLYSPAANLEPP